MMAWGRWWIRFMCATLIAQHPAGDWFERYCVTPDFEIKGRTLQRRLATLVA